ncbi:MAG: hypothetical protein ACLURV_10260 [Gallintestinimicrobium sp.]
MTKRQQNCFQVCMAKRSPCSNLQDETILPITRRIDRVKTWIPEDNEYMDAFLPG